MEYLFHLESNAVFKVQSLCEQPGCCYYAADRVTDARLHSVQRSAAFQVVLDVLEPDAAASSLGFRRP